MNTKKIIVAVTILSSAGVLLLPFTSYAAMPDLIAPSNGTYIFTAQEGANTAASNDITIEINSVSYSIGTLLPGNFGQTLSYSINVNSGDQVDIIDNSSYHPEGLIRYSTERGGRVITENGSNQCWSEGGISTENPLDVSGLISSASGLVSFSCWEDWTDNDHNDFAIHVEFTAAVPQPQPPTVNIVANPSSIIQGNSSILSWSSSNATSCTASNGWSGAKNLSGSQTVTPNQTTTYTITCSNSVGSASDSATITVTPVQQEQPPTADVAANPSSIIQGNSSLLTWSSNNATSCTASNGWSGAKNLSGSQTVTPNQTTTYTITCSNSVGSASDSATITVTPVQQQVLPTVSIVANPSSIFQGNTSILTWSSANADFCTASGGWSGSKALSGSQIVQPNQTITYTIVCTNNSGQAQASATVFVSPQQQTVTPTVTIIASPNSITQGNSSVLTWTSSSAASCSASNGWFGSKTISGSDIVTPSVTTTYDIFCYGITGGSATSFVTVSVTNPNPTNGIETIKTVRNITTNQTTFSSFITAQNLNTVEFNIRVKNLSSNQTWNVFVSDTLPAELFYINGSTRSNLSVMPDGIVGGGISLTLGPNEERNIQFRAIVASGALQKTIVNTATIRVNNQTFNSSSATIQIGGQVLGIATEIPTGPNIPTQWYIAFGFIGALIIYLVSLRHRYQGKLSLASAFSDARLQFKIWRIKRGKNI